jgi:hypothetical protein
MRQALCAAVIGFVLLATSFALAQQAPAPAEPAAGGLADWWWIILAVVVVAVVIWFLYSRRTRI